MELLPAHATEIVIPGCAAIGIAFSLFLLRGSRNIDEGELRQMEAPGLVKRECIQITEYVSEGVTAFLLMEGWRVAGFMVVLAMPIFLLLGYVERFNTHSWPCNFANIAFSFLLGALTSVSSGFLGMNIALHASVWTGLRRPNGSFRAAFRTGAAMEFLLAAIGLFGLYIPVITFKHYYGNDWEGLIEAIAGYGLGASSLAFFGRTGGGIYAKAADVCHRVVNNYPHEYTPNSQPLRRPTVITYNVGDIVGDIAGIGTDLFGSYVQSSCAALVASISFFGIDHDFTAMCYPLLISSMGILVCLITTPFATDFLEITKEEEIKPALKKQLIISTILMTVGIAIVSWISLPLSFTIYSFGWRKVVKNWQLPLCVGVGLWARPIIELFLEYNISGATSTPQDVIARISGATSILASGSAFLGFVNIPIYDYISIGVSFHYAGTYGIALAALGMLSTIPTRLAIDAYDPIRHYANRIAQMARGKELDIDTLAASTSPKKKDTLAATEKGFAIESTALVSFALFGAFARRAKVSFGFWDFQTLEVAVGFILGKLLPCGFSDMTMRSVGRAGLKMVQKSQNELAKESQNERAKYNKFPTDEFLWGLLIPVALVMLTPVIVGTFFGADALFGVLAGSLSSVLRIASPSNEVDEAASNKANKNIRDPLNDASGPPLNILVQLMALESLVFAPFFASHGGLLLKFL